LGKQAQSEVTFETKLGVCNNKNTKFSSELIE